MQTIRWCAIGDSFTYLNDHLDETDFRVKRGYLSRVCDRIPELECNNIGINGAITEDFLEESIPYADLYTILLSTNDWGNGVRSGDVSDYTHRRGGTTLGNLATIIDHIRETNADAKIIVMTPVERGDFVYIQDHTNNHIGSYAPYEGQYLADLVKNIVKVCELEDIPVLNLHDEAGFTQDSVIKFKRVKGIDGYKDCPYPEYVDKQYDAREDEYPYPEEAMDMTFDGLHPTDKGNEIIAELLANKIKEIL